MERRLVDDGSLVAWRDSFSGRHIRLIEPGGLDEYIAPNALAGIGEAGRRLGGGPKPASALLKSGPLAASDGSVKLSGVAALKAEIDASMPLESVVKLVRTLRASFAEEAAELLIPSGDAGIVIVDGTHRIPGPLRLSSRVCCVPCSTGRIGKRADPLPRDVGKSAAGSSLQPSAPPRSNL